MIAYDKQSRIMLAVDCIIFGFDGNALKLLIIERGMLPEKGKWSLMGGFVQGDENPNEAASRVLNHLTGLKDIYMEQFQVFGEPRRDPTERTVSIAYYALIDINKYQHQLSTDYKAAWVELNQLPMLIFDHNEMVTAARQQLRYKAALHPILFELLPERFTIPQIAALFEQVYQVELDRPNFMRKLRLTDLLIKQPDKDKEGSKRGAHYYMLNQDVYRKKFSSFVHFVTQL
ncbi:NUDIX domain-containing protein [Sphingobacterium corticis]|uniref:NUDIX domain-containing protein n=1 Tax=Sphingobacterium corticis TaxID=1812823 RepID=A0ABW5NM53_9SPHI